MYYRSSGQPLMIDLVDEIRSLQSEDSLLMSFCGSLSFLEHNLLQHIQESGLGRVMVLLDKAEYDSSFADAVRGAGIRYRVHPFRLPGDGATFHPKLYLFMGNAKATLFVASANLTPSGFRSNVEIVDRFTISRDSRDDFSVFQGYLGLLNNLPAIDRRLSLEAEREIQRIGITLRNIIGQDIENANGPWFLHSIHESILSQLKKIVLPSDIQQIVAFSPYFDDQSKAIVELAEIFPHASIRLIKDTARDNLNGRALRKLSKRIRVEELISLASDTRRLHAKLLLLKGKNQEWVLSGSANLTRAGLLRSVNSKDYGNLEAVVLRRVGGSTIKRLLSATKTSPVEFKNLEYTERQKRDSQRTSRIVISDAELRGNRITIWADACALFSKRTRVRVTLEDGTTSRSYPASVSIEGGGSVSITAEVGIRYTHLDLPVVVWVEVSLPAGNLERARVWLSNPASLKLTASQRKLRSKVKHLYQIAFPDGDAAAVVSDAIGRFLSAWSTLPTSIKIFPHAAESPVSIAPESETAVPLNEFIVTDEELRTSQSEHGEALSVLDRLASVLNRLFEDSVEADDELEPADFPSEEDEENVEDGDTPTDLEDYRKVQPFRQRDLKTAEELLWSFSEAIRKAGNKVLDRPCEPNLVSLILALPNYASSFLLLQDRLHQQLKLPNEYRVRLIGRDLMRRLLSIDGLLVGGTYGWLVRAAFSETCRQTISDSLQGPGRADELYESVAAALLMSSSASRRDDDADSILAGLDLIAKRCLSTSVELEQHDYLSPFREILAGTISKSDLDSLLHRREDACLAYLSVVDRWYLVCQIDQGLTQDRDVQAFMQELEIKAPRLWETYNDVRHRIKLDGALEILGEPPVCSKKYLKIAPNTLNHLRSLDSDPVLCEHCQRIIVPLTLRNSTTQDILKFLGSTAEAAQ
jgi:HKD family nuclease